MARSLLLAAAAAWIAAGAIGVGVGTVGAITLQRMLPPLAIDLDALRGAVTAVAAGVLAMGGIHAAVVVGLHRGGRRAVSAALLLSGFLSALLLALAAAAATSVVTTPASAPAFLAAGIAALGGAVGYALVGALLVHELRSNSRF
jgi:hypothetical protein